MARAAGRLRSRCALRILPKDRRAFRRDVERNQRTHWGARRRPAFLACRVPSGCIRSPGTRHSGRGRRQCASRPDHRPRCRGPKTPVGYDRFRYACKRRPPPTSARASVGVGETKTFRGSQFESHDFGDQLSAFGLLGNQAEADGAFHLLARLVKIAAEFTASIQSRLTAASPRPADGRGTRTTAALAMSRRLRRFKGTLQTHLDACRIPNQAPQKHHPVPLVPPQDRGEYLERGVLRRTGLCAHPSSPGISLWGSNRFSTCSRAPGNIFMAAPGSRASLVG